jgi:predicted metal-binding membrane protein
VRIHVGDGDANARRLNDVDGVDAEARWSRGWTPRRFLGMWIVMMVAMMLPSLVPCRRYHQAVSRTGATRLDLLTAIVSTRYYFMWTLDDRFHLIRARNSLCDFNETAPRASSARSDPFQVICLSVAGHHELPYFLIPVMRSMYLSTLV